jgi:RNA polymerase sigma-70 factor, ECF subfamily
VGTLPWESGMNLSDEGDNQLLRLALAGAEDAFVALYRRWQSAIYRFALRVSGSVSIAEDVTQEVFMSIVTGGSGFDPERGSFSSYLYGIARNRVFTRISRESVFYPISVDPDEDANDLQKSWNVVPDPLGNLSRQESLDALHRAIGSLPLRYREVVVLCELQEIGYAEASQVIGCPEGTIRSRLHRARSLLLEKLRPKPKEDACAPRIEAARCVL